MQIIYEIKMNPTLANDSDREWSPKPDVEQRLGRWPPVPADRQRCHLLATVVCNARSWEPLETGGVSSPHMPDCANVVA